MYSTNEKIPHFLIKKYCFKTGSPYFMYPTDGKNTHFSPYFMYPTIFFHPILCTLRFVHPLLLLDFCTPYSYIQDIDIQENIEFSRPHF